MFQGVTPGHEFGGCVPADRCPSRSGSGRPERAVECSRVYERPVHALIRGGLEVAQRDVMSSIALSALSHVDFPMVLPEAVAASAATRLQAWLSAKSRVRLARTERAQLRSLLPDGGGDVLTLDWQRGSAASHLARLGAVANGGVDAVTSVGALAAAPEVGLLLFEIKRVLRPGDGCCSWNPSPRPRALYCVACRGPLFACGRWRPAARTRRAICGMT